MSLSDALMWEPCCYRCEGCGRKVCADVNPSPCEDERICADCVDQHGPHGDCYCCERRLSPQEQLEALEAAAAAGPPVYDPETDTSMTPGPCMVCNGSGVTQAAPNFYTREVPDPRPCWACQTGASA